MKIAIVLTGHVRGWKNTYKNFKRYLIDPYDTDIYISTWNVTHPGWHLEQKKVSDMNFMTIGINEVIDTYKPVEYHIENHDEFYKNRFSPIHNNGKDNDPLVINKHHPTGYENMWLWVERFRDQWYMVKKGGELIGNPNQYDLIMRIRFDLLVMNLTTLTPVKNMVVPSFYRHPPLGINDMMAYGSPEQMTHYFKLFDNLEKMYYEDNYDISSSHHFLPLYLREYCNIVPDEVDIPLDILRV